MRWNDFTSKPCHGAWTPAPLSAHPSIECRCTAPHIETPIYTLRTTIHLTTTTYVWRTEQITNRMQNGWTTPLDSAFSFQTPVPTHPECPSQEEPGSGLTASALVSGVCYPVCTNGVCPPLRPVSVAQKNKPSTILSSNVQSTDPLWTAWPDGSGR